MVDVHRIADELTYGDKAYIFIRIASEFYMDAA